MSDTATPGSRLDAALQRATQAVQDLRQALSAKAAEIGQDINAKVDEIQAAIDEIQASRGEATQLPADQSQGQTNQGNQSAPEGQQATGGVTGGTTPPA